MATALNDRLNTFYIFCATQEADTSTLDISSFYEQAFNNHFKGISYTAGPALEDIPSESPLACNAGSAIITDNSYSDCRRLPPT